MSLLVSHSVEHTLPNAKFEIILPQLVCSFKNQIPMLYSRKEQVTE